MSTKLNEEQALELLKENGLELCKDKDSGKPLARINDNGHTEYLPIRSRRLKGYIVSLVRGTGNYMRGFTLGEVLNRLEFEAEYNSETVKTYVRVAQNNAGDLIYDLANKDQQCIRIDEKGWCVEPCVESFRRFSQTYSQALPVTGGSLGDLFHLLNVEGQQRILITAWLVASLFPTIAHPILLVTGSKGSTKTTMTRLLRDLIDPSATFQTSVTQGMDNLILITDQNWCISFDNVDYIQTPMSSFLCKVSTGEVSAKRGLYTDDELRIMSFVRCVLLNGISIPLQKTDLLSRVLWIEMPNMNDTNRISETELLEQWEAVKPKVFGALLSLTSDVLKIKDTIKPDRLHRLADFDLIGRAVSVVLTGKQDAFVEAMDDNTNRLHGYTLIQNPVAQAVCAFWETQQGKSWEGSATQLLKKLDVLVHHHIKFGRFWPKSPAALSSRLEEIKDELKAGGILFDRGHDGSDRFIKLIPIPKEVSKDISETL